MPSARPSRRSVLRGGAGVAATSVLLAGAALAAAPGAAEIPRRGIRLVMVDDLGCPYCARWDAEVGEGYQRSPEGAFAPLVRMRRGSAALAGLRPITHTPTFIVVRDGGEIGRITGYPGAHFFWPLLAEILQRAGYPAAKPSG